MNDFTKEELHHLEYSLENLKFSCVNPEFESKIKDVTDKIQSMIDNYCEHDYRSTGNHPWLHCIKCRNNFNFVETKIC